LVKGENTKNPKVSEQTQKNEQQARLFRISFQKLNLRRKELLKHNNKQQQLFSCVVGPFFLL
jgi:hypothetical protein